MNYLCLIFIFVSIFFENSEHFDVAVKYYEISKYKGDEVTLICESNRNQITDFTWKKKNGNKWTKIFMSHSGGFQGNWSGVYGLERHSLVIRNLTADLAGLYSCLDHGSAKIISEINLTALEPCKTNICPEVVQCTCPTFLPTTTATTQTTSHHVTTPTTFFDITTSSDKVFQVECDKDCQEHTTLMCHREGWRLKCLGDFKCNVSSPAEQIKGSTESTAGHVFGDWQKIFHLFFHGFALLVIMILVIYIVQLRRKIAGMKHPTDSYEIPLRSNYDDHKYAGTNGNTYDFIEEYRLKEDAYEKYSELKSAKEMKLPSIPDYLEVIK